MTYLAAIKRKQKLNIDTGSHFWLSPVARYICYTNHLILSFLSHSIFPVLHPLLSPVELEVRLCLLSISFRKRYLINMNNSIFKLVSWEQQNPIPIAGCIKHQHMMIISWFLHVSYHIKLIIKTRQGHVCKVSKTNFSTLYADKILPRQYFIKHGVCTTLRDVDCNRNRDRAPSFFNTTGWYEMVACCLTLIFYCELWKNQNQ